MSRDHPVAWRGEIDELLKQSPSGLFDRVELFDEVASTQDAAFERANGRPGLALFADRQVAGRGRLGRSWVQSGDLGVAATFVLDAANFAPEQLSLAAGLAAAKAIDGRTPGIAEFGLRWPNDVVEPTPRPGGGRKVAGVLVEVRARLALVGIGVNVLQTAADFPPDLRTGAVSLAQLGSLASRPDVATALLIQLDRCLRMPGEQLAVHWLRRDVLAGSDQEFLHDNRRVRGVVESIDPTHEIVVRTGATQTVRLPAATTSLLPR